MIYFTTPPLAIVDHLADANHCGGMPRLDYRWIVLHATGGTNSLDWLSTSSSPPVSCHRLIAKDGTIYKIVPDDTVAWTQGPSELRLVPANQPNVNQYCLSIELENLDDGHDPYPYAQVRSAVAQVAEWRGLYGDIPAVAHAWIQSGK